MARYFKYKSIADLVAENARLALDLRFTDDFSPLFAPCKIGQRTVDVVVGMESRGFIFGAPIAYKRSVGFVPVRKLGKLPADVVSVEYDLEYGSATLEMHKDAMKPGARVLIVDDLLATGGTVAGTIELVKQLKGEIVACAFLIELTALHGRDKLGGYDVVTLISY